MDSRTLKSQWLSDYMPPKKSELTHNFVTHWTSWFLCFAAPPPHSWFWLSTDQWATFQFFFLYISSVHLLLFCLPVSRSQVSSHQQEVLMENVTRMSEHSQLLHQSLGEATTDADLLENIWKLENLFQNHSDWMQRLEILVKVWWWVYWYDNHQSGSRLSFHI